MQGLFPPPLLGLMGVLLWALPLQAQKFYPDDPLTQEPLRFQLTRPISGG